MRLWVIAGFAVLAAPLAAAAADAPAPIRQLTFATEVLITSQRQVRVDKIGVASGGNTDTYGGASKDIGDIKVDVIAATTDGGLVVDISETGDTRHAPVVRVAIDDVGQLGVDPRRFADLTEEERSLLPLLGRGFFKGHEATAGEKWTVAENGKNVIDSSEYRVISIGGESDVNLELNRVMRATGTAPYDALRKGTIVYDRKMNVPKAVNLTERTHGGTFAETDVTDLSINLRLSSDSFKKS